MKARIIAITTLVLAFLCLNLVWAAPASAAAPMAQSVLGQAGSFNTATAATTVSGARAPADAVVDYTNHRLFTADGDNNRILVYNLNANDAPLDGSADFVLGAADFTTAGSGANTANTFSPYSLDWDPDTNYLFVGDMYNARILVFDVSTVSNNEAAVRVLGQPSFTTSNWTTSQAGPIMGGGVAVDTVNNRLFVSDDNRLLVFNIGTITNGMNAAYVLGQTTWTNNLGAATQSTFYRVGGVAYDPVRNYLYAADGGNNRVMIFDVASIANGENASFVLGQSTWTANAAATTQTGMSSPNDVAFANQGLWVADLGNNRVTKFDMTTVGNTMAASFVYGQGSYTTATAATSQAGMSSPRGVSITPTTNQLWVAEFTNNRVLMFNAGPSMPAAATQYLSDGSTLVSTGGWSRTATVAFSATATSPLGNSSLCVEPKAVATSFNNLTGATCGTAVASGATATVSIPLTHGTQYHWQARLKDASGNYSSWLSFGANSDVIPAAADVGIDTSVPTAGSVFDGTTAGVQVSQAGTSLSQMSANWSGFSDTVSGVTYYAYSIGTTPGATDVKWWTGAGAVTVITGSGLSLRTSQQYFVNVRAEDAAGNTSAVATSAGQSVKGSLTFTLNTSQLTFANLTTLNSYTSTVNLTATTSTNAYGGYRLWTNIATPMTNGVATIPNFAATDSAPTAWSGYGLGYTVSGTASAPVFSNGSLFAGFGTAGSPSAVAVHDGPIQGTAITNEVTTITARLSTDPTQRAGMYAGAITITCVPTF